MNKLNAGAAFILRSLLFWSSFFIEALFRCEDYSLKTDYWLLGELGNGRVKDLKDEKDLKAPDLRQLMVPVIDKPLMRVLY
jgi:hypothetical protein